MWAIKAIYSHLTVKRPYYEVVPPFEVPAGTRGYRKTRMARTQDGRGLRVVEKLLVFETQEQAEEQMRTETELLSLSSFSREEKHAEILILWHYMRFFFNSTAENLFTKRQFGSTPKDFLRFERAAEWIREHLLEIVASQIPENVALDVRWRDRRLPPEDGTAAAFARDLPINELLPQRKPRKKNPEEERKIKMKNPFDDEPPPDPTGLEEELEAVQSAWMRCKLPRYLDKHMRPNWREENAYYDRLAGIQDEEQEKEMRDGEIENSNQ